MQAMGAAEITKVLDKCSITPNSIVYLEHEEAVVGPVKVSLVITNKIQNKKTQNNTNKKTKQKAKLKTKHRTQPTYKILGFWLTIFLLGQSQ
jgi:predicted ribonuclease toxin of YeeF-YezG toxin-antitoxin module